MLALIIFSIIVCSLEQPGATTAHSLFKIPVLEEDDDSVLESRLEPDSARGMLLRAARLITWDELPAAHIAVFEAAMRLLHKLHERGRSGRSGGGGGRGGGSGSGSGGGSGSSDGGSGGSGRSSRGISNRISSGNDASADDLHDADDVYAAAAAVCSQEGPLQEDYDAQPDPEDEYFMAAEEEELTAAARAGKNSSARLLFQELFIFPSCAYCFSAAFTHFPAER